MRSSIAFYVLAATLGVLPRSGHAQQAVGEFRALLVGIDAYKHVTPLKGSVADVRDLEGSLKQIGSRDVRVVLDGAATRGAVLSEFAGMVSRTNRGDTIFLSVSGHGAQEPERVKGSAPDGMDSVFLLADFDPVDRARYDEKILNSEFNHFVKQVEDKGARVVFIADTCSGGGMARDVDPRAQEMSYRSVRYKPIEDKLEPVATRADALMSPPDFKASNFLAAVDRQSKAPEIKVPGLGYRGALSYAVARGLEGAADLNGDGQITASELFEYATRVTYQLSDQRQNIVVAAATGKDPASDVIVTFDRGIAVRPVDPATQKPVAMPAPTPAQPKTSVIVDPKTQQPAPSALGPVRVASLDGQASRFTGLSLQTPIEVVASSANPDLLWDPATRDVLTGGDVIAHNIERNDLPSVIERTAALRVIKLRAARSPQPIRVMPDDKLHHKGNRVEVEVSGLAGKFLLLFNLAGDGTVQLIYPIGSDPAMRTESLYRLPLLVREPLGADQVVAVTSSRQLKELETAIRGLDRRRNPVRVSELIGQFATSDVSVGLAGIFTGP